jgi:hypothetical protein
MRPGILLVLLAPVGVEEALFELLSEHAITPSKQPSNVQYRMVIPLV